MKTVKLTVLFKSGVEKIYYDYNCDDERIKLIYSNFSQAVGRAGDVNIRSDWYIINAAEVASVEFEILE